MAAKRNLNLKKKKSFNKCLKMKIEEYLIQIEVNLYLTNHIISSKFTIQNVIEKQASFLLKRIFNTNQFSRIRFVNLNMSSTTSNNLTKKHNKKTQSCKMKNPFSIISRRSYLARLILTNFTMKWFKIQSRKWKQNIRRWGKFKWGKFRIF